MHASSWFRIYLVVTPKKIRPNSIAAVSVSIFRTDIYGSITVRASAVRGGSFEVAYAEDTFTKPSTRILQIEVAYKFKIVNL